MQSLEIIKKRIQSIETTAKITLAMKMVATAKLQKFKKNYQIYHDYFSGISDVFVYILKNHDLNIAKVNHLFYYSHGIDDSKRKTLYLVLGSDFGMCGSFNTAMVKHLQKEIKSNDTLYLFGSRLASVIRGTQPKWNIAHVVTHIEKELEPEIIFIFALELFDYFIKNQFTELKIVYTKFINSLNFTPQTFQILPIDLNIYTTTETTMKFKSEFDLYHYELNFNPENSVVSLIPQFFANLFYAVLLESKISESSARYNAMSTATDNANALEEEYKLEYNRTRQSSITQEIIEIISGSTKP